MKKTALSLLAAFLVAYSAFAQEDGHNYVPPKDKLVQQKLAHWQDLKFGLMMHWGAYSQWGVVESWSLCPEDEGWTQRHGHGAQNYFDYKKNYENLKTTFNPTDFNPDKWAQAAKDAGMKYVVFTTKHHDGFCMFDTHQTDYKITSKDDPFHTNPKANVTKEVFNAFRKDSFAIGAYFSKPDWHSPDFWWPYFPPIDRFPNYDEAKYPKRWQRFKDFTYNQIKELLGGEYGKVDILWLDGGWVRPHSKAEIAKAPRRNDDVDMPRIANMARALQPGILMVDRSVGGIYENYQTPEQKVPEKPLLHPWETCMTMGNSWSYVPNDKYKPASQLVQLLVKIVSRGGSFLLNIGPGPNGDFDPVAYQRLKEIGAWMQINSDGIYASRPIAPYSEGNIFFTQKKDHSAIYAFYLADSMHTTLPTQIILSKLKIDKRSKVHLLGYKPALRWNEKDGKIYIKIPPKAIQNKALKYAWTFKID